MPTLTSNRIASYVLLEQGLMLPPPRVRLSKSSVIPPLYNYVDSSALNGVGGLARIESYPEIVAEGIPLRFFDPSFDLRLEVLRYRRRSGKSNTRDRSKYVRSSHWVGGINEAGNDRSGGVQFAPDGTLIGFDVRTHWPVTARNQVIGQSELTAFFINVNVSYWNANIVGTPAIISCLTPRGNKTYGQNTNGKHFPYSGKFFPGYFRWRYSIIDQSDPRGGRIDGPESVTVTVSHSVFPFIFDPSVTDSFNRKHCRIDPRFSISSLRAWIGGTRLPG